MEFSAKDPKRKLHKSGPPRVRRRSWLYSSLLYSTSVLPLSLFVTQGRLKMLETSQLALRQRKTVLRFVKLSTTAELQCLNSRHSQGPSCSFYQAENSVSYVEPWFRFHPNHWLQQCLCHHHSDPLCLSSYRFVQGAHKLLPHSPCR